MKRIKTGNWLTIKSGRESYQAFLPDPLPPRPPLEINPMLQDHMDQALISLGRLDSVAMLLPDAVIFLYTYIRKEAVLSSQIEGTQSSLSDLLLFEMDGVPGVPLDDVRESLNYVKALNHGLERLKSDFPLSLRLIKEMHAELLKKGRGAENDPGEFRTSQNWIGGTRPGNARYVPPPPDQVVKCMGDLELFLHDKPQRMPVLIKAALSHVQFESIHPFLDGNGRLGRLLITLLLCHEKILKDPMLYLSLYFKTHRDAYYEILQKVRTEGDWESWLEFFFTAVKETADLSVATARRLSKMAEDDRRTIQTVGRAAGSILRVHHSLLQNPIISIPRACESTGLMPNTVKASLDHLVRLGLVREVTGKRRNRLFAYVSYINILNEGT
ncbi:MAG: Fic family protein [Spirochaetes bacterium]|nr:MAG: Fic family protein [Spirochaetota bacterium]